MHPQAVRRMYEKRYGTRLPLHHLPGSHGAHCLRAHLEQEWYCMSVRTFQALDTKKFLSTLCQTLRLIPSIWTMVLQLHLMHRLVLQSARCSARPQCGSHSLGVDFQCQCRLNWPRYGTRSSYPSQSQSINRR